MKPDWNPPRSLAMQSRPTSGTEHLAAYQVRNFEFTAHGESADGPSDGPVCYESFSESEN